MLNKPEYRIRSVSRVPGVGRSLAVRRTWYADENKDQNREGEGQGQQGGDKREFATVDDAKAYIEALEKRLGERDAKLGEYRDQLTSVNTRLTEIETARKKQLETEGNFQELAKQRAAEIEALSPYKDRAATLEKIIRESNEARVNKIPENMRALVPTDYPPEKLQTWLNANETLLTKPPAPDFDAGAGGTQGRVTLLTAEQKDMAAKMGMTEKQYAEMLSKHPPQQ